MDAVKNRGIHIVTIWEEEKLPLGDIKTYKQRFFVRVPASLKDTVKQRISGLEEVKTEKVKGEFAFITPPLTGYEFEEAVSGLDIISRIMVNF